MGVGYTIELIEPGGARVVARVGGYVGKGTNNEAEYEALLEGLRHCLKLGLWEVTIASDSLLVVNQIAGKWQCRDATLKRRYSEAQVLLGMFTDWSLHHVRREENAAADALSRQQVYDAVDPKPTPFGTIPRKFCFWQAAAIRFWWKKGLCRSSYLMARIFGVNHTAIEQIVAGKCYKGAGFEGRPYQVEGDETYDSRETVRDSGADEADGREGDQAEGTLPCPVSPSEDPLARLSERAGFGGGA